MSVQSRRNQTTVPFIKNDSSKTKTGTIQQDESRTTDLLQYTVMALIAATEVWVPFNSVSGTNGSAMPRGIYLGDTIDSDDLIAGDIENAPILYQDAIVDGSLIVWDDDTLSADSVIGAATIHAVRAEDALRMNSDILLEDTENISEYEN